jgi:hypothetical protein
LVAEGDTASARSYATTNNFKIVVRSNNLEEAELSLVTEAAPLLAVKTKKLPPLRALLML